MGNNKSVEEIKAIHDLNNVWIAKEIRKDLKEAFWKNFVFSVTCKNNSIDVIIMKWNIEFYTDEYKKAYEIAQKNNGWENWEAVREMEREKKMYTFKWASILKEVKEIRDLYNHNNSDLMTDYFDVNYYWDVSIGKWDCKYILI